MCQNINGKHYLNRSGNRSFDIEKKQGAHSQPSVPRVFGSPQHMNGKKDEQEKGRAHISSKIYFEKLFISTKYSC